MTKADYSKPSNIIIVVQLSFIFICNLFICNKFILNYLIGKQNESYLEQPSYR